MAIRIGCGSWADAEYASLLYPRGFPAELRLSAYAMWFDHLEVNATYYASPKKEIVARWVAATPPSFRFQIRLHRAFSQSPVKSAQEASRIGYFLDGLEPLMAAKRLSALLLVLPPSFRPLRHRLEELDGFIEKVRPHPLAVELRHSAWVNEEAKASTVEYFGQRKIAWVAVDMPQVGDLMPPVDAVTLPKLAYLRLHGRNLKYLAAKTAADRHAYAYLEEDLVEIEKRIVALAQQAREVIVVANNHFRDYAPRFALALKERLKLL